VIECVHNACSSMSSLQKPTQKLTKWENSVSEALSKIITYAERRLHPACQRAHLLLEELIAIFRMQEVLPPNHLSEVSKEKVDSATSLLRKVSLLLYLGTGLAMKAREELGRFKEFVMWLRHGERDELHNILTYRSIETQRAQNSANEAQGTPVFKHDPSDVTRYLESGLVVSEVDRWFEGDEPGDEVLTTFMNPISCPGLLLKTLDRVENLLQGGEDSVRTSRYHRVRVIDYLQPSVPFDRKAEDKNMLALVQTLTQGCSHLFQDVSHSVTASTQITAPPLPGTLATHDDTDVVRTERTIWNADENAFIEFVALYFPGNPRHRKSSTPWLVGCSFGASSGHPEVPVSTLGAAASTRFVRDCDLCLRGAIYGPTCACIRHP
jgi:anaphase-promoting complex subunit 4